MEMDKNQFVMIHRPTLGIIIGSILDAASAQMDVDSQEWAEQREKDSVRVRQIVKELEDAKANVSTLKTEVSNLKEAQGEDRSAMGKLLLALQIKENELKKYRRDKRKSH